MSVSKFTRVSVVMAVHAIPREMLEQAIESILQQTFTAFELIIVCDAPDDDEIQHLLLDYKKADPRVVVYFNEQIYGFPRSTNRAIAAAQGEYVVRMDADDISLPDRIRLQILFMERNPHIGISGMQAEVINQQGKIIGLTRKPCSPKNVAAYLRHATPVIHPTYIVRRKIYEQLGGYRDFSPGQDYEFLIRANRSGIVIANQHCVGLKYRRTENSLSNKSIRQTMKMGRIMRCLAKNPRLEFPLSVAANTEKESLYFRHIYNNRNLLISLGRQGSPLKWLGFMIAAVFVSMLHMDLFRDSYHGFFGALIVRREKAEPG